MPGGHTTMYEIRKGLYDFYYTLVTLTIGISLECIF